MVAGSHSGFFAFVASVVVVLLAAVRAGGFPATLKLERGVPLSHELELSELRARDRARHGRLLQSSLGGVVDFNIEGTFDPFLVGLYYTKLQIGNPPKEYYVQIDTGSDVLWISCAACNGCPQTSGLQIQLNFYDPKSSTTSKVITCSDERCHLGAQFADSGCSVQNNLCSYVFQYGDGSGTSGYYVTDNLYFDTIVGSSVVPNSSAPIVFGCSTSQTGDLVKSDRAVSGIFGFGQRDLSVISQLAAQRIAPRVFSHCLKGSNGGGGILVLGEIVEPNMVFTPLASSQAHYNVDLQSISINGQALPINPSVFSTSSGQGTIVDTGTTLSYLAEGAYDPFVQAITSFVSQSAQPIDSRGSQCYAITSSVSDVFPQVSLNFAGGASLILAPQDYLIQQNSVGPAATWCIGFQKVQGQAITILGDLVLKDKIFVYDLAGQRIGWTRYDCSQPVNISATSTSGRSEYVNSNQLSNNSSPQIMPCLLLPGIAIALLLHMTLLDRFLIL